MAVMNKVQMKKLVEGQFVVMDKSRDIMRRHLPDIAIASHGDSLEALRDVVGPYISELEELVAETNFFGPRYHTEARDYLEWLRTL